MVAMIRPTLLLKMDIDENVHSTDLAAEVKRSFSYVSPALIETHESTENGIENTIRFIVKMRQPYWSSVEEGADALWNDVMLKWFTNMFTKVSATIASYAELHGADDDLATSFDWLEVDLENDLQISFHLDSNSTIPEGTAELLDKIRFLAAEAAFGEGQVSAISVPSREAVETYQAALKELAQASVEADQEETQEAGQEPELDYAQWDISYADGSARRFDANSQSLI